MPRNSNKIEFYLKMLDVGVSGKICPFFMQLINNKLPPELPGYLNAINYLEKEKRVQKKVQGYNPSLTTLPEEHERSLPHIFQSALNKLPAQRLKAFTLVYMEEKKYEEAAAEMGISINSIKSHLKLAVKSLKNQLHNIK